MFSLEFMSKNEEPQIPDYISKHQRLYKHASKIVDTTANVHSKAYVKAVGDHLMDKKDGNIDFERLDDSKVQSLFVKTMSDMYVSAAKKHFKIESDLGELEEQMLMQTYAGVTREELRNTVKQYGKNFTHAQFDRVKQGIQQNIAQKLNSAALSHLDEQHIGEIVKYVGVADKIDSGKVTLEEAKRLLEFYHESGSITKPVLESIIPDYKRKKKAA